MLSTYGCRLDNLVTSKPNWVIESSKSSQYRIEVTWQRKATLEAAVWSFFFIFIVNKNFSFEIFSVIKLVFSLNKTVEKTLNWQSSAIIWTAFTFR